MEIIKRVQLKDGSYEWIQSNEQLANLVGDAMGKPVGEIVLDLAVAADYTEQKVDTDLESYEASLESNASTFSDISEIADELIDCLRNTKKIDRNRLLDKLNRITSMISANT